MQRILYSVAFATAAVALSGVPAAAQAGIVEQVGSRNDGGGAR